MNDKKTPPSPASLLFRNALIIISFVALGALCVWYFLSALRVEIVLVEDEKLVPETVVLEAADIPTGRHLYGLDDEKIEREILETSPYVKSVTIERKWPKTVIIRLTEHRLSYYITYEEKTYLITDELMVMEETSEDAARLKGAIPLSLPKLADPKKTKEDPDPPKILKHGQTLSFSVQSDLAEVKEILSLLADTPFFEDLTAIDLCDPFAYTIDVSGDYHVKLGNKRDLEKKLSRVENALRYLEESMPALKGILYATKDSPVTFSMTGVKNEDASS